MPTRETRGRSRGVCRESVQRGREKERKRERAKKKEKRGYLESKREENHRSSVRRKIEHCKKRVGTREFEGGKIFAYSTKLVT